MTVNPWVFWATVAVAWVNAGLAVYCAIMYVREERKNAAIRRLFSPGENPDVLQ